MSLEQEPILSPIITLTVNSPAELRNILQERKQKKLNTSRYVSFAVTDQRVITQLFQFKNVTKKNIEISLITEVADLLSLPARDIILDFQILHADSQYIKGVFVTAPKSLVEEYLGVLDDLQLIPVKMISSLMSSMESFFLRFKESQERVCVIDTTANNILHFFAVEEGFCRLLRRVDYESESEFHRIVIQCLQNAYARSDSKKLDAIYFLGNINDKFILSKIKENFDAEVHAHELDFRLSLKSWKVKYNLNLFKDYVFSVRTRNLIFCLTYAILFLLLCQTVLLAVDIKGNIILNRNMKMTYTDNQYEYAQSLLKELSQK